MDRLSPRRRADWQAEVERLGFHFHTIEGELYWDESVAYSFTLREIEDGIEAPTGEIEQMCFRFVERAIADDEILTRLAIPREQWELIRESWQRGDRNLYGRLDLAYDGKGPAKLLEYNADTPTALFEASVVQWHWLEQAMEQRLISRGCDQFNSLHEKLIAAFKNLFPAFPKQMHFTGMAESPEDLGTIEYIQDCASQAGLETRFLSIEEIGLTGDGRFADENEEVITHLFKLYPWEWLFREQFGANLRSSGCRFVEPPWKAILSNKGLLAYLWQMESGHPNLLPTFFEDDPAASALGNSYVKKPLYSREGANVSLILNGVVRDSDQGPYGSEGHVVQEIARIPQFGGRYPVLGSWLVASEPCGLGIREDATPITKDTSRFVPHIIDG